MLNATEALLRTLLLALLVVQAAPSPSERPPTYVGTVVRVVDGDTLHVHVPPGPGRRFARKVKVRLYGIDAPELEQTFGAASARELERLVGGRLVEVHKVTRDDFGRLVAVVRADGVDVSSAMVRGGYAWAFRRYLGQRRGDEAYCDLEYQARAAQAGLWSTRNRKRTAPWVYRRDGAGHQRIDAERSVRDCIASFEGR